MADDGRDIDLLLASLRADAADGPAFLGALSAKLDGALPGRVHIERRGGLFSHEKHVRRIEIDLGDNRYTIADAGNGHLQSRRVNVVRGISLKTEELPVETWIASLAGALSEQARSSVAGREALERLLLG